MKQEKERISTKSGSKEVEQRSCSSSSKSELPPCPPRRGDRYLALETCCFVLLVRSVGLFTCVAGTVLLRCWLASFQHSPTFLPSGNCRLPLQDRLHNSCFLPKVPFSFDAERSHRSRTERVKVVFGSNRNTTGVRTMTSSRQPPEETTKKQLSASNLMQKNIWVHVCNRARANTFNRHHHLGWQPRNSPAVP